MFIDMVPISRLTLQRSSAKLLHSFLCSAFVEMSDVISQTTQISSHKF